LVCFANKNLATLNFAMLRNEKPKKNLATKKINFVTSSEGRVAVVVVDDVHAEVGYDHGPPGGRDCNLESI
jgi:hypothetical protein